MAVGPTAPTQEGELLRVYVAYLGAPDAREAGSIIERIAGAFEEEVRQLGRADTLSLCLEAVEIQSLIVLLRTMVDSASAALTLAEHRDILGGFIAQIGDAIELLKRGNVSVSPGIRGAIDAVVRPVSQGRASHIRIDVVGDNNRIIVIERADADAVYQALTELRQSPATPDWRPQQPADKVRYEEPPSDTGGAARRTRMSGRAPYGARSYPNRKTWTGTAHRIADRWYVALRALGDQLLDLETAGAKQYHLQDKTTYEFTGDLWPNSAIPTAFVMTEAPR